MVAAVVVLSVRLVPPDRLEGGAVPRLQVGDPRSLDQVS